MGRRKQLENRTEMIVEAARELFGRYGFEKTTIDDIARHAGIGKGSIYLEFQTKQDILLSVIEEFVLEMQEFFANHIKNAEAPYLDSLEQLLLDHVLAVHQRATSQIHTPDVLVHTSRRLKERFKHHYLYFQSCVLQMLELARKNGELQRNGDLQPVTESVMLGLSALCPPYLRNSTLSTGSIPTREELEHEARGLIKLLLNGVKQEFGVDKSKNSR